MSQALVLEVRTGRTPVPINNGIVRIHENLTKKIQIIVCGSDADGDTEPQAWLDSRLLDWLGPHDGFRIPTEYFNYWVGGAPVRICIGEREEILWLDVQPHALKGQADTWSRMVSQLERWLPGVTLGHTLGRHGTVDSHGAELTTPLAAEALVPLVPAFVQALCALLMQPKTRTQAALTDVPLRAMRTVDGTSLRQAARDPSLANRLYGDVRLGADPRIVKMQYVDTPNHSVNRWLLVRATLVATGMHALADDLDKLAAEIHTRYCNRKVKDDLTGTALWSQARAGRIRDAVAPLGRLLARPALRKLAAQATKSAGEVAPSAIDVIYDQPEYRQFYELSRLFLSPRFRLTAQHHISDLSAAVRPSFTMYELWTLLFVHASLRAELPAWKWDDYDIAPLCNGSGTGAYLAGTGREGDRLTIHFNCIFPSFHHRDIVVPDRSNQQYSLSTERRPDIVICFRSADPQKPSKWLVLDAKYAEPTQLERRMAELHTYRDCLWMEAYGGRPAAGLLLAPKTYDEHDFATDAFRDRYHIGVWECPPGARADARLARWILARLGQREHSIAME